MVVSGFFLLYDFYKLLIYKNFVVFCASDMQLKRATDPVAAIF